MCIWYNASSRASSGAEHSSSALTCSKAEREGENGESIRYTGVMVQQGWLGIDLLC